MQIIQELSKGERVSSLSDKLFISKHTVRNHLRNIFSKLNVHSQSELVAYVKDHPSELGLQLVETIGENQSSQIAEFTAIADERVANEISEIFQREYNPEGLKKVMRTALPIDPLSEQEWKYRIRLMNIEIEDKDSDNTHAQRIAERRARVQQNVSNAQKCGWISDEKSPKELTNTLYSMVIGAAMQILRSSTPSVIETQLSIIDEFIESISL